MLLVNACYGFNSFCVWQLRGWYEKDDVVAEWKKVKNEMFLHVHCFVSGPNPFLDLAAEFRYHIFSKEMPLVCLIAFNLYCPLKASYQYKNNLKNKD